MHITLAYVASVNGKITKGDESDIHAWTSDEDRQHFDRLRDSNQVIVIDRKTYEAVRPEPEAGKLRVVFTSTPERFESVPSQLEFVNMTPTELVTSISSKGYKKILIAGGARLSTGFLAAGLVDELYLSFEPILFGAGRPMITEDIPEVSLKLRSLKQLNERGTMLVHYSVIKRSSPAGNNAAAQL